MPELQDPTKLNGAQRPRTAARVAAVQALFQIEQNGDQTDTVIEQFLVHRFGTTLDGASYEDGCIPEADTVLFRSIVRDAIASRTVLTDSIRQVLPATWPLERLDPVLRALFLAAGGEGKDDSIPTPILINEYMDVAHSFFSGDEPRLVNGVLDALLRKMKSADDDGELPSDQPND